MGMMRMKRGTPGYMVKAKIHRKKLRKSAGKKVWLFEKRLAKEKASKIAIRCLKELRKRRKREVTRSRWKEEKRRGGFLKKESWS